MNTLIYLFIPKVSFPRLKFKTFTTVAQSIENHYERILNFFVNRSTNAAAEAFNAKIKAFRAAFRGVVDMKFFLFRIAKVYA